MENVVCLLLLKSPFLQVSLNSFSLTILSKKGEKEANISCKQVAKKGAKGNSLPPESKSGKWPEKMVKVKESIKVKMNITLHTQ